MKRNKIYYIDEAEVDLRTNAALLEELFQNTGVEVHARLPLRNQAEYNRMVANPNTAAFILDQRMRGSGLVNYNGTELASHLRGINPKLPIYILTGYPTEQDEFRGVAYRVEDVIDKRALQDTDGEMAQIVKARMLRRLENFNDVMDDRERRFHELLVKSLREELTEDEQKEMDLIEGETTAPVIAAEREETRKLEQRVGIIKSLLERGDFPS